MLEPDAHRHKRVCTCTTCSGAESAREIQTREARRTRRAIAGAACAWRSSVVMLRAPCLFFRTVCLMCVAVLGGIDCPPTYTPIHANTLENMIPIVLLQVHVVIVFLPDTSSLSELYTISSSNNVSTIHSTYPPMARICAGAAYVSCRVQYVLLIVLIVVFAS